MSIYHCHISNVSRAKGSNVCASMSYALGKKIKDCQLDQTFDYGRKERILDKGVILSQDAPSEWQDAATLANAIEQSSKIANARLAKKIELALPYELDLTTQKRIVETFIRDNFTSRGYCAAYAIHDAGKSGKNYHAHIIVSNRPYIKGKWQSMTKSEFARDAEGNKIPVLDAEGKQKLRVRKGKGAEKVWQRVTIDNNVLDKKDFLKELRKSWEVECNKQLDANHQIDCRSNKERGIVDEPTIHEGYGAGRAERHDLNLQIKARNAQLHQIIAERKQAEHELSDVTWQIVQDNVRADQIKKREQKAQQENLVSRASAPTQKNPEQTKIKNAPPRSVAQVPTQQTSSPRVNDTKQTPIVPTQKPLPHLFLVKDYTHLHAKLYMHKSKNPQLKKRLDALNLRGDKNNYSYIYDADTHDFCAVSKRDKITIAVDLNKQFAKTNGKPLPPIKHNAPPPRVNIGDNFLSKFSAAQSALSRANELQQKALDNAAISANIAGGAAWKAMVDAENAQQSAKDFWDHFAAEMRSIADDARGIAQMKMDEAQSLAAAANDVPHD